MIAYIEHLSPVGTLRLAATDAGICGIYFEQHRHLKNSDTWNAPQPDSPAARHLAETARQLDEYFAGRRTHFDITLDVIGTPFQRAVWSALASIPFGESRSYAQLAQQLGNPKAVRAVGSANGRNPVSIIVPCHRVIGASGDMTGYAGGVERKRFLLALEGMTT